MVSEFFSFLSFSRTTCVKSSPKCSCSTKRSPHRVKAHETGFDAKVLFRHAKPIYNVAFSSFFARFVDKKVYFVVLPLFYASKNKFKAQNRCQKLCTTNHQISDAEQKRTAEFMQHPCRKK